MTRYDELRVMVKAVGLSDGPCLIWHGAMRGDGYGALQKPGHGVGSAHRLAYEVAHGAIPDGLVIDHVCRVRACYRPAHLRAVTARENQLAPGSMSCAGRNSRKTHCPRGHALTDGNLVLSRLRKGLRNCLTCDRELQRLNRAKREKRAEKAREKAEAAA